MVAVKNVIMIKYGVYKIRLSSVLAPVVVSHVTMYWSLNLHGLQLLHLYNDFNNAY